MMDQQTIELIKREVWRQGYGLVDDGAVKLITKFILDKCIDIVDPGITCGDEWFRARAAAVQEIKDYFGATNE